MSGGENKSVKKTKKISVQNVTVKSSVKSNGKYSELPMRIASAIVLAIFTLYATWKGGLTFSLLSLAASVLIFLEYRSITSAKLPLRVAIFCFGFLCILWASWFLQDIRNGIFICLAGLVVIGMWEYLIRKSLWGPLGILYAALPFIGLSALRAGDFGMLIILLLFATVWGADTLAYFSGKTFGGAKLAPSISPGKTWSGFFGGVVGACILASVVLVWFDFPITILSIIVIVALALLAQIGDLFESGLKRHFGVKDSGKIIPGHGGVLDRIDGLIFACVATFVIGAVFTGINLYSGEIPNWIAINLLTAPL